ncbi:hypothetical protein Drorol1_Dr00019363, partial [Drosera rotundifolia]
IRCISSIDLFFDPLPLCHADQSQSDLSPHSFLSPPPPPNSSCRPRRHCRRTSLSFPSSSPIISLFIPQHHHKTKASTSTQIISPDQQRLSNKHIPATTQPLRSSIHVWYVDNDDKGCILETLNR